MFKGAIRNGMAIALIMSATTLTGCVSSSRPLATCIDPIAAAGMTPRPPESKLCSAPQRASTFGQTSLQQQQQQQQQLQLQQGLLRPTQLIMPGQYNPNTGTIQQSYLYQYSRPPSPPPPLPPPPHR